MDKGLTFRLGHESNDSVCPLHMLHIRWNPQFYKRIVALLAGQPSNNQTVNNSASIREGTIGPFLSFWEREG